MKEYTFIKPDPTLQNNLMAFGFECAKGWYPLLEELFDELQKVVDVNPEYEEFEIIQVKEKWGSLVIYCNYYYEELEKIIEEYCEKALNICEFCGSKDGVKTRKKNGWYSTICEKCYNER